MSNQRSRLFDDTDNALDLSQFEVKKPERPEPSVASQSAKASGFKSREPKASPVPAPVVMPVSTKAVATAPVTRSQRRHRTGRNIQLNVKVTPETLDAFYRIADANNWVLGEVVEKAVELLEKQSGNKHS